MGASDYFPRVLLTVEQYHKMIEAEVFHEDDRIELIEGELIVMPPIGGPHIQLVNFLNRILVERVGDNGVVSVQNPVAMYPRSEPQPDLVLLHARCLRSRKVPTVDDVHLIVEVSESTLAYDRGIKARLYAKHAIPEFWIFEPTARAVTLFRDPETSGYRTIVKLTGDETISPLQLPTVKLSLHELWLED